ncbi:endolytic transglycosylase MltG [Candidatus Cerribacteria bacterium 'Amazon FNV 2010 28 9']|uniref:Endolytic murein transglycosylase n=1 Tax=Candidatus Cerribacteria bacterium 'Amazon FNV 2010 28 9' TaxID=2081795 RepID=A0A317JNM2_9BACT|nr:MAG: endolytic transglycosylase MltG [Candidatus Cerribacteria bacterium 'Amazon FNV 2010 28 9']
MSENMKKIVCGLIGIIGIGAAVVTLFFAWILQPVSVKTVPPNSIVVAKGQTINGIARQLEDDHIVHSQYSLRLLLFLKDPHAVLQTGTYDLSPSMRPQEIITLLLDGPQDMWITLPEGWRREEMAQRLSSQLGTKYFDPAQFLSLTKNDEGMLFPDTYLFPKSATAQYVVDTMESNFKKRYQKLIIQNGAPLQFTQNEVLTLASIVNREGTNASDMRMIAGVLINRLNKGMALQTDASIQYALGYDPVQKTWWQQPTAKDLSIDSPFNTYIHKGLPPSPICDPGEDAIAAVLAPTQSDYLFYIADHQGVVHFAKTLEEHDALIQKYLK